MSVETVTFISLSLIFMVNEVVINMRKRSAMIPGARRHDRGSLAVIWIVVTLSFTIGFSLAHNLKWSFTNCLFGSLGMLLYIGGMIVRWISVIQLDKAFTVDVAFTPGQELKTDGMYRIVRHPSYLGAFMVITGVAIGMNSILSFLIVTIPVFVAFAYRIKVEETFLIRNFGEKYRDYSDKTRKLIPFVY
jgi:protein-S-isoprenylcysteine O-methyltransferase Ste14